MIFNLHCSQVIFKKTGATSGINAILVCLSCFLLKGISFNFDRRIVNTLKSHCMLDYARCEGKQDLLAENLFQAYFQEAKDINSLDVLAKIAVDTGLNLEAMER